MDRPPGELTITPEAIDVVAARFLSPDAKLLPPGQWRTGKNGAGRDLNGVTEVFFIPAGEARTRMADFQKVLKRRFPAKVYLVDEDRLHVTVQGLEEDWADGAKCSRKPWAVHSGLDRLERKAWKHVTAKALAIRTPSFRIGVSRLNFNPCCGVYWELCPDLKAPYGDILRQRRDAWGLPESRPPHVTAAYFSQPFTADEERQLRALLERFSIPACCGDILVDVLYVIAYSNPAFNASSFDPGFLVLEKIHLASADSGVSMG
jgi:hypothetical protein